MLQGVIVYRVEDYQQAIELGVREYASRYGRPPSRIALPCNVAPAGLDLHGLELAGHPASVGTVQVGHTIAR